MWTKNLKKKWIVDQLLIKNMDEEKKEEKKCELGKTQIRKNVDQELKESINCGLAFDTKRCSLGKTQIRNNMHIGKEEIK